MAHVRRDLAKEGWWREVISRHGASGVSVREFCRRESLRESAFHSWRRTIAARDGQLADVAQAPVVKLKPRSAQPSAFAPAFVPAVVTNAARRDGAISIELAGGRVLRLPDSMDAARLAEIVQALETSAGAARGPR